MNIKTAGKPLIIAHRGFADGCRENTLEAFEKAISIGADMIEFDVRRTSDGQFIVIHDSILEGKDVSDLKYEEIRKISLSKGYLIPTLEDVLQSIGNRILLDIEIKITGYEVEIAGIILKHIKIDRFLISSFNDSTLKKIKSIKPDIQTGLILGKENPNNLIAVRLSEIFPKARLKKTGADFIIPHWKIMNLWSLPGFIKPKGQILVWTVDDDKDIGRLIKKEINGIITDRPDIALRLQRNHKKM